MIVLSITLNLVHSFCTPSCKILAMLTSVRFFTQVLQHASHTDRCQVGCLISALAINQLRISPQTLFSGSTDQSTECSHKLRVWSRNGREGCSGVLHDVITQMVFCLRVWCGQGCPSSSSVVCTIPEASRRCPSSDHSFAGLKKSCAVWLVKGANENSKCTREGLSCRCEQAGYVDCCSEWSLAISLSPGPAGWQPRRLNTRIVGGMCWAHSDQVLTGRRWLLLLKNVWV